MGNPFAPTRVRRASESRSDLELVLHRLHVLGLDQDGLDDVRVHWHDEADDWDAAQRARMVAASDVELRELIKERNAEWEFATTTQEQADLDAWDREVAQAEADAMEQIGGTVKEVAAWVGRNRARALAVSNLERGPHGANRVSLLAVVDGVLNGA